jgi:hypothetical protein
MGPTPGNELPGYDHLVPPGQSLTRPSADSLSPQLSIRALTYCFFGGPILPNNSMLDNIGRIVGLAISILFMAWAVCSLSFGWIQRWDQAEIQIFFALLILFSGPIAYFWIAAGSEARINLILGTFVICGAYAVAFAIAAFVQQIHPLISHETWQTIELDTDASKPDQVNAHLQGSAKGHVWITNEEIGTAAHTEKLWIMIVRFDSYDPNLRVKLTFYNQFGGGEKVVDIPRDQVPETPHLVFNVSSTSSQ